MDFADLKKLDAQALVKEVILMKKELLNIKLSSATTEVRDSSQSRKLRVRIAQAKTILQQKK